MHGHGGRDRNGRILKLPRFSGHLKLPRGGVHGSPIAPTPHAGELDWTIWGDERDIVYELAALGAHVRESSPLSLNDAALALLTSTEALPRRVANG